jgi:hypothetical protein
MKKLSGLIVGVALIGVAPLALADADPYENMPQLGGAETTFAVKVDQGKGINADPNSDAFWYAGTSGVSSN